MKVQISFHQLLCTVMTLCRICLATDSNFRHFTVEPGKRLNSGINMDYFVSGPMSKLQCAARCGADDNCMAASFQDDGKCYMSTYHLNGPENGQMISNAVGWSAMSKTVCPENWIKVGDMCYHFVQEFKSHTQAQDNCIQEGGILAEPRTNDTHVLLTNYMYSTIPNIGDYYYWIGLIRVDGDFVWQSDSTTPTYSAWTPDGSNGSDESDGSENCVVYPEQLLWDVVGCLAGKRSICQCNLI